MKRRTIIRSIAGLPAAAAALPAQTTSAPSPTEQFPKLALEGPDTVGDGAVRFFTKDQFAALRKLCDLILPATGGRPSANDTGAAEFLDFLVRESPAPVQTLYREGLDRLGAGFAAAGPAQAEAAIAPLKAAWTYAGPSDPFARFLQQAKSDILQAAMSSREYAEAASRGRRGAGGLTNYFWRAVD
ncbi:MAG: gluconate 2-dehydrogenase subunit 3 family protein [Acidobacteria bacterium]|nr:gluconate 2-dehydrogenase subunit 3 family protein [Acidobacteriota bacterium]